MIGSSSSSEVFLGSCLAEKAPRGDAGEGCLLLNSLPSELGVPQGSALSLMLLTIPITLPSGISQRLEDTQPHPAFLLILESGTPGLGPEM